MLQNKNKKFNKKGFSLTELLVVFVIMAVMMGIALKMSRGNKDSKDLETAAREVAQMIRQAQNNALGGKLPDASSTTSFACGYLLAFGVGSNNTDYRMGYVPKAAGSLCNGNESATMGTAVTLKNGVQFEISPTAPKAIYFEIPRGEISQDGSYDDASPSILLDGTKKMNPGDKVALSFKSTAAGSLRVDICVYASGVVEEKPVRNGGAPSC